MDHTVPDSRHKANSYISMGNIMIHTPDKCASKFRIVNLAR